MDLYLVLSVSQAAKYAMVTVATDRGARRNGGLEEGNGVETGRSKNNHKRTKDYGSLTGRLTEGNSTL